MKIKLSPKLVLVRCDEPKEQDEDGIFIQEAWKTQPPTGTVKEVGSQVKVCKPGDKVFFERYTSIDTPFGEDIRICREDAILAVYEK